MIHILNFIFLFKSLAFSNKLSDIIYKLIADNFNKTSHDVKLNTLNIPDTRLVANYSLITAFYSDFSFRDSLILNLDERILFTEMLNYPLEVKLIYRASRDGFEASSFHSKCNGISITVKIIKTTSNSVFGGLTAARMSSYNGFTYDATAFIFSLRRLGYLNKQILSETAIYGYYGYL